MKTQICNGVATIDPEPIARGIYAMMTEEYRAALAFGMLPAPLMGVLEKMMGEKAEQIAKDQAEKAFGFRPEANCCKAEFKAQFIREASRAVTQAMYGVAPMVV